MNCYKARTIVIVFLSVGVIESKSPIKWVDFDVSMGKGTTYRSTSYKDLMKTSKRRVQLYDFFKRAYLLRQNLPYQDKPQIPLIIHQIWLGPNNPPKEFERWKKTWIERHPTWKYLLWTDKDVARISLENRDIFDEAKNWGEKADILRCEIINQFGGLYIDVDFECLKSFDELHHIFDFYTGIGPFDNTPFYIGNGLMAARPGHPIIKACIEGIRSNRDKKLVADRTGPPFFIKILEQTFFSKGSEKSMAFPSSYFYPVQRHQKKLAAKSKQKLYRPESFAIHHWAGSWRAPKAYITT